MHTHIHTYIHTHTFAMQIAADSIFSLDATICLQPKEHETHAERHHIKTQTNLQTISSRGKNLFGVAQPRYHMIEAPCTAYIVRMSQTGTGG